MFEMGVAHLDGLLDDSDFFIFGIISQDKTSSRQLMLIFGFGPKDKSAGENRKGTYQ